LFSKAFSKTLEMNTAMSGYLKISDCARNLWHRFGRKLKGFQADHLSLVHPHLILKNLGTISPLDELLGMSFEVTNKLIIAEDCNISILTTRALNQQAVSWNCRSL